MLKGAASCCCRAIASIMTLGSVMFSCNMSHGVMSGVKTKMSVIATKEKEREND